MGRLGIEFTDNLPITVKRVGKNSPNSKGSSKPWQPYKLREYRKNRIIKLISTKCLCEICGSLDKRIETHHIDKDSNNHSIDNLQVLCKRCHIMQHK